MKYESRKRTVTALTCGVSAVAIGIGAMAAFATPTDAAPTSFCVCTDVYAPVICDGGATFTNQCWANCFGATGCVPGGLD